MSSTAVFVSVLAAAAAAAFDPVVSSSWIEKIARSHRCRCVNLIHDYQAFEATRIISKLLSRDFHSSRVLSAEDYLRGRGPHDCPTTMNVVIDLEALDQLRFLNSAQEKWIIILDEMTDVESLFNGTDLPFDSAITLVRPVLNLSNVISLQEAYRVHENYPLRVRETYRIDMRNKSTVFFTEPYRMNLERFNFIVGLSNVQPYSYRRVVVRDTGEETVHIEGYFFEVFHTLSEALNFQYTLQWHNMAMGTFLNGTWTGVSKLLDEGLIDVLLGAFNFSPDRLSFADFPGTLLQSRYQIYTRAALSTASISTLLEPFEPEVWGMVIFWLAVVSICLFLNLQIRKRFGMATLPMPTKLSESIYFTTQALCQQAYTYVPHWASIRVIIFVAFITANTIVPSYSGSLISSLTQRYIMTPFRNLDELYRMGFYVYVGEDSEELTFLLKSNLPVVRSLVKSRLLRANFHFYGMFQEAVSDVFTDICENKTARLSVFGDECFLDFQAKLQNLPHECRIAKMDRQRQPTIHQSFAVKRGNPYNIAFRLSLLHLRERGILSKYKNQYWLKEYHDPRRYSNVELSDVKPVLIVYAVGVAVAFLIFFIENFTFRIRKRSGVRQRHLQRFDYYNPFML